MASDINQITADDIERFNAFKDQSPNMLRLYQELATKSAIYPGQGSALGLAYTALKLNGEAGEFAEHVGKAMRDDGSMEAQLINRNGSGGTKMSLLTEERRISLIKEIGDVLWYLSAACNELGITLSDAALVNLEKLHDRANRNALRGSGDNR